MSNINIDDFLSSARKQFEYYKSLGDRSLAQVSDDASLFWSPNENSNSIAVIVQHQHGNMLSRWTDFLISDGEKNWRQRDQEFELYISDLSQLLLLWEEAWHCLFKALDQLDHQNFGEIIYIRNEAHSILGPIERQLCHYSYHIGQIVYLSKIVEHNWQSLTIAKGESIKFN
jgi:hypothetical protein